MTAPYDGVIAECCYSAVGSDVKSGTLLCRVAVLESIFVYNSQGAGKNLRFGMDVDLVINDVDYKGTVTAAPDTAPRMQAMTLQNTVPLPCPMTA